MTPQALIHYCVTSHLSSLTENVALVVPKEKAIVRSNSQETYRSSHRKCSAKKNVILKISQNSHENTYTRVSFLIKLQDSDNYLYRCFPVNFAKLFPSLYFELKARKRVLRFQWRHNDASSPKAKIMAGYRQFSTLWHIGNNNQQLNLSHKETPKYLN